MKVFTPKERATVIAALSKFAEDMRIEARFDTEHFDEHDPLSPQEIKALCLRISEPDRRPLPTYLSESDPIDTTASVIALVAEKAFARKLPTIAFCKVEGAQPFVTWEVNADRKASNGHYFSSFTEAVEEFFERR
jgi:hypothetical protein